MINGCAAITIFSSLTSATFIVQIPKQNVFDLCLRP